MLRWQILYAAMALWPATTLAQTAMETPTVTETSIVYSCTSGACTNSAASASSIVGTDSSSDTGTGSYSEPVPTLTTSTISSNTVTLSSAGIPTATISPAGSTEVNSTTVGSTILVIARDQTSASVAVLGLNGYGIPFQTLIVPQSGAALPTLNTSSGGNFGGIIVVSGVVYDYGSDGWKSALTEDQWNQLYAYQLAYGVRMVQWDIWPDSTTGVEALGSCCDSGVEQLISFSNTSAFSQAGLRTGAGMSTQGMYHYPVSITDPGTTWEIAQFASNSQYATTSTAAVINNFSGREQMVFFIPFAQDWSSTSAFLQHAFITWMTRGLYAGYRRVYLNTQIDDMMLSTNIYNQATETYRVTPEDMEGIANWVDTINAKMNPGSDYLPEIGHNGNGVIIEASQLTGGADACGNPIYIDQCYCNVAVEFVKSLGTGINVWPTTPTAYNWSLTCINLDALQVWFANTANRDKFYHLSHTFTHLAQNNATYSDILKEIQFNQAWLSQAGLANGKFSSDSLIPPAITGIHNGDALRAWHDAGLTNCVGDNTRPLLRNTQNDMWPFITTTASSGFEGMQVNPRWATRIYYNCYSAACTTQEWIDTSAGSGTFYDLLDVEKSDTMRHFFGLYHDPYMFHQANLRNTGVVDTITINGVSSQMSIFQAWVETAVQEFVRLANWPLITIKQSDFSASFAARMARDQCGYNLSYTVSNRKITAVTVSANSNQCSFPIPVTFPGPVVSTKGYTTEQVGNDPLTIWVPLSGSSESFTLTTPIDLP